MAKFILRLLNATAGKPRFASFAEKVDTSIANFVQHMLGDEDRNRVGNTQRDGVARPAVDRNFLVVLVNHEAGEERAVHQVGDLDPLEPTAHGFDDVREQVVCQGARRQVALEPAIDGLGFLGPDDDRELALAGLFFQNNDLQILRFADDDLVQLHRDRHRTAPAGKVER